MKMLKDGTTVMAIETKREKMILDNMGLVHMMVHKAMRVPHVQRSFTIEDAVQSGMVALIRAVDKFDPTRGWKFGTYACRAIWNELLSSATFEGLVRVPATARGSDVPAHIKEAAFKANVVHQLEEARTRETLPDKYHEAAEEKEIRSVVWDWLHAKDANRHQRVLRSYYGIGTECLKQKELAAREKLSKQRIQQIVKEGLTLMRTELAYLENEL